MRRFTMIVVLLALAGVAMGATLHPKCVGEACRISVPHERRDWCYRDPFSGHYCFTCTDSFERCKECACSPYSPPDSIDYCESGWRRPALGC